jgi:hypothetical protein
MIQLIFDHEMLNKQVDDQLVMQQSIELLLKD